MLPLNTLFSKWLIKSDCVKFLWLFNTVVWHNALSFVSLVILAWYFTKVTHIPVSMYFDSLLPWELVHVNYATDITFNSRSDWIQSLPNHYIHDLQILKRTILKNTYESSVQQIMLLKELLLFQIIQIHIVYMSLWSGIKISFSYMS